MSEMAKAITAVAIMAMAAGLSVYTDNFAYLWLLFLLLGV
jgi:hypothetical protein